MSYESRWAGDTMEEDRPYFPLGSTIRSLGGLGLSLVEWIIWYHIRQVRKVENFQEAGTNTR